MIDWLPKGKKAAICFSIDDVHPAKSTDDFEAGGDLEKGALGLVLNLIKKHPELRATLFVTADWRETTPLPKKKLLASIPRVRDHFYLAKRLKRGTMSLENHPEFVNFLNKEPGFEVALHGLTHTHKGLKIPVEFQNQTEEEFEEILSEMLKIFNASGIDYVKGICPPGWNAPDSLLKQLVNKDIKFVASARDVKTKISRESLTNMSGLSGLPLLYPTLIEDNKLVHFPVNFQATSTMERAMQIIENNGLLSIKAHIIKNLKGFIALDGVDQLYMNYLDVLFNTIKNKYGDAIWWTSMGEMTDYVFSNN